jgi:hypothetical protein
MGRNYQRAGEKLFKRLRDMKAKCTQALGKCLCLLPKMENLMIQEILGKRLKMILPLLWRINKP